MLEVATRTLGGVLRVEQYDSSDLCAALRRSGMRGYLAANTVVLPAAVQRDLEALRARGGSATVFAAGDAGLLPPWRRPSVVSPSLPLRACR